MDEDGIYGHLRRKGISRRNFLKFCALMAGALSLPPTLASSIAEAFEAKRKPTVVWLEFSDCAADSEAALRSANPSISQLILELVSLDYHETLMAPAGRNAEKSLLDAITANKGKYIAIVEGAIPMKDGGVYCCVAGKTAIDRVREVCGNAQATIAVGSCASFGGIPAAKPNPTGAVGVKEAVPSAIVINMPGCPVNPENLTALLVHYLTFGAFPALDTFSRPLFAYGKRIHDNCERRPHFDAGQFVTKWGDEGHKHGWCLYKMGCKGPQSYLNCPTVRYNGGTSWPVMAGHPCFACAVPDSWDALGHLYDRLANVEGAGYQATANQIGVAAVGAAVAGVATHAVISAIKSRIDKNKPEGKDDSSAD